MMKRKNILLKNGETISYLDTTHGNKTLVLIHGNTSSSIYFKPLLERLPNDIRVIAPDLRGFGNSSYVNRFDTLKELAKDVNLLLESLGVKEFYLGGWSLGGGVAMELSLMNENVLKLILIASVTHTGFPLYQKNEKFEQVPFKGYISKEEMALDPVSVLPLLNVIESKNLEMMQAIYDQGIYLYKKPSKEDSELYAKEALKMRSLVDADWAISNFNLSNTFNGYNNGTNEIGNIKIPVLHLLGDKDLMVPDYMLNQNVDALENSKVIRYKECSHSPFVDVPDIITKDILEFLK